MSRPGRLSLGADPSVIRIGPSRACGAASHAQRRSAPPSRSEGTPRLILDGAPRRIRAAGPAPPPTSNSTRSSPDGLVPLPPRTPGGTPPPGRPRSLAGAARRRRRTRRPRRRRDQRQPRRSPAPSRSRPSTCSTRRFPAQCGSSTQRRVRRARTATPSPTGREPRPSSMPWSATSRPSTVSAIADLADAPATCLPDGHHRLRRGPLPRVRASRSTDDTLDGRRGGDRPRDRGRHHRRVRWRGRSPAAESEPPTSELIGLGVAVIVLLVSFGSVLAMGLPLITALIGLGIGLTGITLLSAFIDLSSTAPTLATMIGLAVGIDYALFIVTRHRQNLAEGLDRRRGGRPGQRHRRRRRRVRRAHRRHRHRRPRRRRHPVPHRHGPRGRRHRRRSPCSIAVTLLPALLGFVGAQHRPVQGARHRRPAPAALDEGETLGARWARQVTDRPVLALVGGLAIMGVLAVPLLRMRLGMTDAGTEPPLDHPAPGLRPARRGLRSRLQRPAAPSSSTSPAPPTAEPPSPRSSAALAADAGVVAVGAAGRSTTTGDTAVVTAIPATGPVDAGHRRPGPPTCATTSCPPVEASTGAEVSVTGSTAAEHRHLRQDGRRPADVHGPGHRAHASCC